MDEPPSRPFPAPPSSPPSSATPSNGRTLVKSSTNHRRSRRSNLAAVLLAAIALLALICPAFASPVHLDSHVARTVVVDRRAPAHIDLDFGHLVSRSASADCSSDHVNTPRERQLLQLIDSLESELARRRSPPLLRRDASSPHQLVRREELPEGKKIGFAILVVCLVLLSGVFAGLTLGYMSLDETQLQVLSTTGTPKQKQYANKIIPIRKDGHLLLTTLILLNMLSNEALPVVFDPLLGGGIQAVVVSTALIVIFSELIPQSVCTRYGLAVGAYMAVPMRCLIILAWPVAWPVSRILHWVLGPHQGIIYRRSELKELVTMHAATGGHGGDLKGDTVMIVGGALDMEGKTARDAMTPIDKVFMLPLSAKLDYATLDRIVRSGHSRIPVYQEIEVPAVPKSGALTPSKRGGLISPFRKESGGEGASSPAPATVTRKKILGALLVKSCVLLDPEDAVPVSEMALCALPTVSADEPLLNLLNAFQEGRSHMAIVSPRRRRPLNDSIADLGSKSNLYASAQVDPTSTLGNIDEEKQDVVTASSNSGGDDATETDPEKQDAGSSSDGSHKKRSIWKRAFRHRHDEDRQGSVTLEQKVPSDARLTQAQLEAASEIDEYGAPLQPSGVICLEDLLEELIGEEILDEYDGGEQGGLDFRNLQPPSSPEARAEVSKADVSVGADAPMEPLPEAALEAPRKTVLSRLGLTRKVSSREGGAVASPAFVTSPSAATADDYLTAGNALTPAATFASDMSASGELPPRDAAREPRRANSMPPSRRASLGENGAAVPTTPGAVANRPVVVRAQPQAGGPVVTAIVGEGLLQRGRPGSSTLAAPGPPPSTASSTTRSSTPSGGARVHRFKSQPVVPGRRDEKEGEAEVERDAQKRSDTEQRNE